MKIFNRSSLYLFPIIYHNLYLTKNKISNKNTNGFDFNNLYLALKDYDDFNNYEENNKFIHLVINIYDINNIFLHNFLNQIKLHPFYFTQFSLDEKHFNIVFKLDDRTGKIIEYFKKGQYSLFPSVYIDQFISTANGNINSVYNICTKNPFLKHKIENDLQIILDKDAELDDIPYKEKETFYLNKENET